MATDLELALRVTATVGEAKANVAGFNKETGALGPIAEKAGAQASAAMDAVQASAAKSAAAISAATSAATANAAALARTVDTSSAKIGLSARGAAALEAEATGAAGRLRAEVEAQAEAWDRVHNSALASQDLAPIMARTAKSAEDLAAQEALLDRLMREGRITAEQQAVALNEITAQEQRLAVTTADATAATGEQAAAEESAAVATGRHADAEAGLQAKLVSGQSVREETALLDEALAGRYRRMPGTLAVLGSRAGITQKLFSGVGGAAVAVAVGLAVMTAAVIKGEKEEDAFNRALEATGGYLGVTRGDFRQMEEDMAGSVVTIGAAKEALVAVAQTGRFSGQQLLEVGRGAAAMAELTGLSVQKAVGDFVKLADDPVKAVVTLNEQYHFLTASVYDQIAALQQEGDIEGATEVAIKSLSDAMQQRTDKVQQNEGIILRALHDEKRAWSQLWDAVMGIGRAATPEDKLRALIDERNALLPKLLAARQGGGKFEGMAGFVPVDESAPFRKRIDDLNAAIAAQQKLVDAQKKAATNQATLDKENQDYVAAAANLKAMNAQFDKQVALEQELNALAENKKHVQALAADVNAKPADRSAAQQLLDTTDWDKLEAGIRAKYRDFASSMIALDKQELATLEAQDNVSQGDRVKFELAFWQKKLAAAKSGSTAYAAIYQQMMRLKGQEEKATGDAILRSLNAEAAKAKSGSAERVAAYKKEAAEAKRLFGEMAPEYTSAVQKMNAAIREHDQLVLQLDQMEITSQQSAAIYKVSLQQQVLKQRLAMGQISAAQETQGEVQLENRIYQIKLQALQQQLALGHQSVAETRRTQMQIEQLTQQHSLRLAQLTNQAVLDIRQHWISIMQPITQTFQTAINGMIQGTQTFRQAMANLASGILGNFISLALQMLMRWIATHIAMATVSQATNETTLAAQEAAQAAGRISNIGYGIANIITSAAVAAAGAAASVAAIPYVGWIMAPAVAAQTFASTAAYASVAAAKQGWWEIPQDQMAMVHQEEMVLPAPEARGMRKMIKDGSAGGGDTFHIHAMDSKSFHEYLQRNGAAVANVIRGQARNFAFGA